MAAKGWVAALGMIGVLFSACGGSSSTSETAATTSTAVLAPAESTVESTVAMSTGEQVIWALGGALTLEVPAGAVPEGTTITLEAVSDEDVPRGIEEVAIPGSVVRGEPAGVTFAMPATLTWRLPAAGIVDDSDGAFIPLLAPVVLGGGDTDELLGNVQISRDESEIVITADVTHFSTFYVVAILEVDSCQALISLPAVSTAEVAEFFTVEPSLSDGLRESCRLTGFGWNDGKILTALKQPPALIQDYLCTAEGTDFYSVTIGVKEKVQPIAVANLPYRQHVLIDALGRPVRPVRTPKPPPEVNGVEVTLLATGVCTTPPAATVSVSMITGTAIPGNVWSVASDAVTHLGANDGEAVDFVILFRPGEDGMPVTAWISVWDTANSGLELFQEAANPRHGGCGTAAHVASSFLTNPDDAIVGPDGHLWCPAPFFPGQPGTLYRYLGSDDGETLADWSTAISESGSVVTLSQETERITIEGIEGIEVPPGVFEDLLSD